MKKRIYSFIFIALLGLALSLTLSSPRAIQAEEVSPLHRGLQFYQNEQYASAVEVWREAIATHRENSPHESIHLYTHLSLAYQHLGHWQDAQQALNQSFTLLDTLTPPNWPTQAKALNALGRLQWMQGQPEQALETWKQAQNAYAYARDIEGAIGTQLNQAKALQALGLSFKANRTLETLYSQLQQQPPSPIQVQTYLALGTTRRRLGELNEAQKVLTEGLKLAQHLDLDRLQSELELELGNTARSQANQQKAIGKIPEAETQLKSAFKHYQNAATEKAGIAQLQAHLNQLNLAADTGSNPNPNLLPKIDTQLNQVPLNRTTLEARLNYARSLSCWQVQTDGNIPPCIRSEWRDDTQNDPQQNLTQIPAQLDKITHLLITSIQAAKTLKDQRLQASAIGQLGALYEQNQQWQEAESLTRKVIALTDGIEAGELRYRFQWQLGRLLKKQNHPEAAIEAYAEAIESLDTVRYHLLKIDPDVQFSFRDNVEPVYREYIDLLLETQGDAQPKREKLEAATAAIDKLQLAEIENFLRCDLSANVRKVQSQQISDPHAAIIYPIVTQRGLALIFKVGETGWDYRISEFLPSPNKQTENSRPKVSWDYRISRVLPSDFRQTLENLRRLLSTQGGGYTDEVKREASQVYNWLFKPLENFLAAHPQVETLVFVLDEPLRNIPMGVLYDGKEYLMQKKYALVVAPSLKLFPPQQSQPSLRFASGGVGQAQTIGDLHFEKIEYLKPEIEKIPQPNFTLLNEKFTKKEIENQLQSHEVSAIHWKTHGVFSSDPDETYLVAYNEVVQALDLNQLIQIGSKNETVPLELLVLSACSSAEGDKRAVLGMAGIAARSGAKTTLSTLWRADDFVNTKLMEKFYKYLSQIGMTKAQALHLAQQELFDEPYYKDPHIWGTYVLVGSWR
jgi:CHAT domain-containing protein